MAVQEQTPYIEYIANGSTTSFALGFDCSDQDYLIVLIDNNPPEHGSWYLENNTVIFRNAPQANQKVSIERSTPLSRATNFKAYDNSFRPETINFDFDKLWLVLQEQNLIDGKILARLKEEIEWRRTHDLNFDELAKVREAQIFGGLKQYVDTYIASTNPNIFGGVTAGIVFALDQKSLQTHLDEILEALVLDREDIENKADLKYVNEKLNEKAPLSLVNQINETKASIEYVNDSVSAASAGTIPFSTEIELLASTPVEPKVLGKALDTRKEWLWENGMWSDTGLSDLDQAKEYSDEMRILADVGLIETSNDLSEPDDENILEIKKGDDVVLRIEGEKVIGNFFTNSGKDLSEETFESAQIISDLYEPNSTTKTQLMDGDTLLAEFPLESSNPQPTVESQSKSYFYNAGSAVKYINDFGEYEVETQRVIEMFIPDSECSAIAVSVNEWMHNGKSLNVFGVNGCLYPNPLKILVIVPAYGQSLSVGSQGVPGISFTNPQSEYALMMKGIGIALGVSGNQGKVSLADFSNVTNFESIRVKTNSSDATDYDAKELFCIPFAQKVSDVLAQENDLPIRILSFSAGVGGTALDNSDFPDMDQEAKGLKKGSNAYVNLMNAISKAKEIAELKGWKVVVPVILWQHGEADASNANYSTRLNTLISDVNTDVKAIAGQTQPITFYTSLKSNHYTNSTIGLEQSLEVARTNSLFKIIGTNYVAEPAIWASDYTHLSARGYNYLGFMYAKAFYQDLKNGIGSFQALTFKSAVKSGKTIDVKFNVPVAPIKYKTTDVVLAQAGWGFRFTDDGTAITLSNVEITGDDSIRITLATEPTSATQVLTGAMYGHTSSDLSLNTRPRSNICDSDTSFGNSAGGDSTENWLIPFKYQF